ncbi:MAG: MiaB/RimO family radical SAM methylthiotransferase, partial [Planctomycetota bacterium]
PSLLQRIRGIDALVGVNNRDDIVRAVRGNGRRRAKRSPDVFLGAYHPFVQLDTARLRLTPRHYAYLRISEGCDQKCTFCTIPSIRGRMHCKPPDVVLAEARELIADGASELILIGQDTSSYGEGDFPFEVKLDGLLRRLDALDGVRWIRLMYVYPTAITDALIDALAECDRVCKYIDMPLQHINDRILKAMHRRITRAETEAVLAKLRERIPNLTLRTTMMVGFPGETEAEFAELVDFVRAFRFDALGTFAFSREPGTPADRMADQIPEAVKRERVAALMEVQREAAFQRAREWIGRSFEVVVDGRDDSGTCIARHQGQAPEVDGVTKLPGVEVEPGSVLTVRCVNHENYDLVARSLETPLPLHPSSGPVSA